MATLTYNVTLYKTDGTQISSVPSNFHAYYGASNTPTTTLRIYQGTSTTETVTNNTTISRNFRVSIPSGAEYTFSNWECSCNGQTGTSTTNPYGRTSSQWWSFTTPRSGSFVANINIYLQYPTNSIITYDKNAVNVSGNAIPSDTVPSGSSITLPNPTGWSRTGYSFSHWNTASDGSGVSYAPNQIYYPSGDITFYAQWESDEYTVTFAKNSIDVIGPSISPMTSYAGSSITLPNPTGWSRTGYSFSHWNTASDGSGVSYTPSQTIVPAQDLTLYAQWVQLAEYSVDFLKNAADVTGADIATITGYAGSSIILPNPTGWSRPGYYFDSWNTQADGSGNKYDVESSFILSTPQSLLYAQWELEKPLACEISFKKNNPEVVGDPISPVIVLEGDSVVLSRPTSWGLPGGTFNEWNTQSDGLGTSYAPGSTITPLEDITLYAIWTAGSQNTGNYRQSPPCDYRWDATVNPNGLYFNWYGQYNLYFATNYIEEPITLQRQFRSQDGGVVQNIQTSVTTSFPTNIIGFPGGNLYLQTRYNNTGTETITTNYANIDAFTFTAPSIDNFEFLGWYSLPSNLSPSDSAPSLTDLTLLLTVNRATTWGELLKYLRYHLVQNTSGTNADGTTFGTRVYRYYIALCYQGRLVRVLFNPNGGTVNPWYVYIRYKETYNYLPTPTYTGHQFIGWYTSQSGGNEVRVGDTCIAYETHILYAHWISSVSYTLNLNAAGGIVSPSYKIVNGGDSLGTLPTPTYNNHIFQGWWTSASGGDQVNADTIMPESDITIYAQWDNEIVNITFVENAGSSTTITKSYVVGLAYGQLPIVLRNGYKFNGWWTASESGVEVLSSTTVNVNTTTLYAHWVESKAEPVVFIS